MPELAELIAPRNLLIVAGKEDYLADIEGVRAGNKTALKLFEKNKASDHIVLVEGDVGHQFYPDLAWNFIDHFRSNDKLK